MMDTTELREKILLCKLCSNNATCINAPKHGSGKGRELMLVGLNPPQDPKRAMHGAWMVHYPDHPAKGVHELLMQELIDSLHLDFKQVTATNAVKCPTVGNAPPDQEVMRNCWAYLTEEVRICDPKVTILFGGHVQERAMFHLGSLKQVKLDTYTQYEMEPIGQSPFKSAWRAGTIIGAPHPSVVGRFVTKESWIKQLGVAYVDALGSRA